MNVRVLTILFFMLPWGAYAQFPSEGNPPLGKFSVDAVAGCTPFVVTLTSHPACPNPPGGNPCSYIWTIPGSVQPISQGPTMEGSTIPAPTTPGTYYLNVITQGGSNNDRVLIEVTANIAPEFNLYSCGGREVKVDVTDTNYTEYFINYNDGSPEVNGTTAQHQYGVPPPLFRNVSVRGRNGLTGADNCISNTKPVKVVTAATLPRDTINQVLVLDADKIQLGITPDPTTDYRLMIATNNSTSFQYLGPPIYNPGSTTKVISGLRPDDNVFYCFRLDTFDHCANAVAPGGSSSVICSTDFDVTAQDFQNNASNWVTAPTSPTNNYLDFTLNRDGSPLASPLAADIRSYMDMNVVCKTLYNYQLVINYADGSQSISMAKPVTAFTTQKPPAIDNISSVVGSSSVDLEWQSVPGEFSILKSTNGNYSPLATTTSSPYTDTQYSTANTSCYQISYTDNCDKESLPSIEACPIRLSGNVQNDNTISLSWSDYTGWTAGVNHYVVEKFDNEGQLIQTFDPVVATTMSDITVDLTNQIYTYIITAVPNDASVALSVSNEITLIKNPNLFYPTAFTPNSDGLNDDFKVFGQYVTAFQMKIFNRWGEMLYSSDDLDQSWDGTYKGNLMPEATYVFTAQLTDLAGRTFDRSGSVLLLRKK